MRLAYHIQHGYSKGISKTNLSIGIETEIRYKKGPENWGTMQIHIGLGQMRMQVYSRRAVRTKMYHRQVLAAVGLNSEHPDHSM